MAAVAAVQRLWYPGHVLLSNSYMFNALAFFHTPSPGPGKKTKNCPRAIYDHLHVNHTDVLYLQYYMFPPQPLLRNANIIPSFSIYFFIFWFFYFFHNHTYYYYVYLWPLSYIYMLLHFTQLIYHFRPKITFFKSIIL